MVAATSRVRRDTAANWTTANPILSIGEIGWETDNRRGKIGDGSTLWATLPYSVAQPRDWYLEHQGAVGDGTTDDSAAINATIAKMKPGDRLIPDPTKVYAHSGVIDLTVAGMQVIGGTFKGLTSSTCAMLLTAPGVIVRNVTKNVTWSVRTNTLQSHSFVLRGANQILEHVTVNGSGGVGIFAYGASDYLIESPRVLNTGADGIHNTNGSTRGKIKSPRISGCGDDHLAFVSYIGDPAPVSFVEATDVYIDATAQTQGRGIAVVGGQDITVDRYYVSGSWGASVYVVCETSFPPKDIQRIKFLRGEVVQPNRGWGAVTPVNQGAVLISNQVSTNTLNDVEVRDLLIRDAGTSEAPGRYIGFANGGGGTYTNVRIEDLKVRGTTPAVFYSDPNTVVTTSTFRQVDLGPVATASLPNVATYLVPYGATVQDTTLKARAYATATSWQYIGVDPGFVKLASNQTALNTTTVAAVFPTGPALATQSTYEISGLVIYDASTTGDLKMSFTSLPSGSTIDWIGVGLGNNATTLQGSFNSSEVNGGGNTQSWGGIAVGGGSKQYVRISGYITTANNAGNLTLSFAQNALDAVNATTIYAGTWLRVERVA